MRRIQSLFKTLLMLIPMTAVPVMAIFGIPQFLPVSASPSARSAPPELQGRDIERRVGQSDALTVRRISTGHRPAVDLFEPYESTAFSNAKNSAGVVANVPSSDLEHRRIAWKDPLASSANTRTEVSLRTTSTLSQRREEGSSVRAREDREVPAAARRSNASSFSGQAAIAPRMSETRMAAVTNSKDAVAGRTTVASFQQTSPDTDRFALVTRGQSQSHTKLDSSRVQTLTWQQAVDRLNQLGIRTFRLMPDSGQNGYRFVCLVTSVDDPRISRRFEAESNDPLVAVGDVLAQVENWNQYR